MAFLRKKASPNKLIDTALAGDAPKLYAMVQKSGVNVSQGREDGLTALHAACQINAIDCCEMLLNAGRFLFFHTGLNSSGADVSALYHGRSALQIASSSGFVEIARLLLRGEKNRLLIDACEGEAEGMTALHLACIGGHQALVELHVSHSANPEKRDRSGQTSLILSLEFHQEKCAKVLIESGRCNLNTMNAKLETPLHIASRLGLSDIVALLLKKGVNVSVVDELGRSALEVAQQFGHEAIAQMISRQQQLLVVQQERSLTNAMALIEQISPVKATSDTHLASSPSSSRVHVDAPNVYDSADEDADETRVESDQPNALEKIALLESKMKEDKESYAAEMAELQSYIHLLEKNNKVLERSLTAANNSLARSGQEVSSIDVYKQDRLNAEMKRLECERDELLSHKARAEQLEREVAFLQQKVSTGEAVSNVSREMELSKDLVEARQEASAAKAQVLAVKKQLQETLSIESELKSAQAALVQASRKVC
jgi:hypothetical protein